MEDLKTSVAEVWLNAVEHGNKGRPDTRVIVAMSHKDGACSILVVDEEDRIKGPPKSLT